MRLSLAACSAALVLAAAHPAHAQPAPTAESLFQEARALVDAGDYAAACPKLEESQRLEPAVGTQFNLADCYEHVNRTATAYKLFTNVASIARAAGKFEREKNARDRANALEPRLARLQLQIVARAPGLEIELDGAPIERAQRDAPFPVDPGPHRLTASAPERRAFTSSVVAVESKTETAVIPELEETAPRPPPSVVVREAPTRKPRAATYVVAGLGAAALVTGTIAGVVALSKNADAEKACPPSIYAFRCPTQAGTDAWNGATTAGDVSTVAFIASGVALAAAAVLWLTSPKTSPRSVGMSF